MLEIPDHPHINLSDFIMSDKVDIQEVIDILKKSLGRFGIQWAFIYLSHILEDSFIVRCGKMSFFYSNALGNVIIYNVIVMMKFKKIFLRILEEI